MTPQFVDTYYLLALVNSKDKAHDLAMRLSRGAANGLVTTTWVLSEFADALCTVASRDRAARFIRGFQAEPYVEIIPPSREQFERALDLYDQRGEGLVDDRLSLVPLDGRTRNPRRTDGRSSFRASWFPRSDASAARLTARPWQSQSRKRGATTRTFSFQFP